MKAALPFALSVLLILTGCKSTLPLANELRPGMTRPEVIALLGKPAATVSSGANTEILRFVLTEQRAFIPGPSLKTEYVVLLKHGQVDAYGCPDDVKRFIPNPPENKAPPGPP